MNRYKGLVAGLGTCVNPCIYNWVLHELYNTGCTIIENIHARKYIRYNRLKNIYAKKYQRLDTWVDPWVDTWVVPWEIIIKNENACFRTHSRDLGAIPPRK